MTSNWTRFCNRAKDHGGDHDFGRSETTNVLDMCGPQFVDETGAPLTANKLHTNRGYDAGALAFYVRDLLDAAGYRYSPDGPLHGQVRECCELITDTRAMHDDLSARIDTERERHAAEVQRLEDLVTELRKQLVAALKLTQKHGAEIEPWDFPEPLADGCDAQTWAAYRKDGG